MRLVLTSLFLVALSGRLSAQTNPPPTLYGGSWSTANPDRMTVIAAGGNQTARVFRITAPAAPPEDVLRFGLVVDGVAIPMQIYQGGSAVVEGKSIAIQQVNPGPILRGSWAVLQAVDVLAETINWYAYPDINREVLVASLATEQDFVLGITGGGPNCRATSMTVTIDGTPVMGPTRRPIVFPEGSQFLGRGKSIVVQASGTCLQPPGGAPVQGTLRIRKPAPPQAQLP